jgi:hypothetical protein
MLTSPTIALQRLHCLIRLIERLLYNIATLPHRCNRCS